MQATSSEIDKTEKLNLDEQNHLLPKHTKSTKIVAYAMSHSLQATIFQQHKNGQWSTPPRLSAHKTNKEIVAPPCPTRVGNYLPHGANNIIQPSGNGQGGNEWVYLPKLIDKPHDSSGFEMPDDHP